VNNARKMTLLEKAVKRLRVEAVGALSAAAYTTLTELAEELADLTTWLRVLKAPPDQDDE